MKWLGPIDHARWGDPAPATSVYNVLCAGLSQVNAHTLLCIADHVNEANSFDVGL